MNIFDWHFLPDEGGLLDQDKALMDDLLSIHARRTWLENQLKAGSSGNAPTGAAYKGYQKRIGGHARVPEPTITSTRPH